MAYYIKRLKGYLAPLLVCYTVVVTLFLAQTAWNDGASSFVGVPPTRSGQFLDVLVQEERRHMKSFEKIVRSNRLHERKTSPSNNNSITSNAFSDDLSEQTIKVRSMEQHHQAFNVDANGNASNDAAYFKLALKNFENQLRPTFTVEVEDWDNGGKQRNASDIYYNKRESNLVSMFNVTHKTPNISQRLRKAKINVEQKVGFPPSEMTYSLEYCSDVYENVKESPNICKRDPVIKGSLRHAGPSAYSLPFRNIGDIYIYSAFLDLRNEPSLVRLMAIGPQGRDGKKSAYWCVFYKPVRSTNLTRNSTTTKLKQLKEISPLTYWAASAGHNLAQQFYIMTCEVPDKALESFNVHLKGTIRIVKENKDPAIVKENKDPAIVKSSVEQSISINVINNSPEEGFNYRKFNKKAYINQMEKELKEFTPNDFKRGNISDNKERMFDHVIYNKSDIINNDNNVTNGPNIEAPNPNAFYKTPSQDKIVACVAPLQGHVGVLQIVEYIELTLLLGSQHLVFYMFRVFEDIKVVLKMYEDRGLVTVLPWGVPDPSTLWAKGRDAALNDCLYRTMHLFDYALFLDLDEFFVPRVTPDIPSFLKYLQEVHNFNSSRYSDVVFSSAYYPPPSKDDYVDLSHISGGGKEVGKFLSLKSVRRSYYNQQHTLRMIRPASAYRVGSGERRRTSYTISTRYASVHHYSYCPKAPKGQQETNSTSGHEADVKGQNGSAKISSALTSVNKDFCTHTKIDWIMWRYKTKLIERTKQSIRLFNS